MLGEKSHSDGYLEIYYTLCQLVEIFDYFKLNNMKNTNKNLFLIISMVSILTLPSCNYDKSTKIELKLIEIVEKAYFEGQRDYANGDKRIKFTNDSCWVWTKSPWESGKGSIYNPCLIHSKDGK